MVDEKHMKLREALVAHTCAICGALINEGDKYYLEHNVDENSKKYQRRLCVECAHKDEGDC